MNELFQIIAGVLLGVSSYYIVTWILGTKFTMFVIKYEGKTYRVIKRWNETEDQALDRLGRKAFGKSKFTRVL